MPRTRSLRSIGFAALLFLALPLAPAAGDDNTFSSNVRPFFAAGPSIPIDFDYVNGGFGVGMGFEVEQSRNVSLLFRVEWHFMQGGTTLPFSSQPELRTTNWALGARAYLPTRARIRPYADGTFGVRLAGDPRSGLIHSSASASSTSEPQGLAMTLRVGISTAGPRRPGLFLDSGFDFLLERPERHAILPVRLGILLP